MKVSKKVNAVIAIFEENDFQVHTVKEGKVLCAEIETWTTGGVNMIHYLRPFTVEEFERMVNGFDVDEEIDGHRQDSRYRDAFRITESVKDFEEYHTRLKDVLEQLNAAEKPGRKK
jgi:hypothetical protein